MSNEENNANHQTFPTAHAYIQVSHTDGSFSEIGVNLAPAFGPHDVEDALEECCTPHDVLACLLRLAQDGRAPDEHDSSSHAYQVPLNDEEMDRSSRILREALDETDPAAEHVLPSSSRLRERPAGNHSLAAFVGWWPMTLPHP